MKNIKSKNRKKIVLFFSCPKVFMLISLVKAFKKRLDAENFVVYVI